MVDGLPDMLNLGANDTILQKGLRSYGKFAGKNYIPWCLGMTLFFFAIVVGGWSTRKGFGGSKPVMNPEDMEFQWSESGGELEKNLRYVKDTFPVTAEGSNPWAMQMINTMFVARDTKDEDKGDDVLTRAALLEMYDIQLKWTKQSVTVNGLTYHTEDICHRGILPDLPAGLSPKLPAGTPLLPCTVVTPLHCFNDFVNFTSPMYQAMDPTIDKLLPGFIPYKNRPKLWNSTDAEIKAILSGPKLDSSGKPVKGKNSLVRGCYSSSSSSFWYAQYWGGKLEWSGDRLTKAEGVRQLSMLDASKRIAYRMGVMANEPKYTMYGKMGYPPFNNTNPVTSPWMNTSHLHTFKVFKGFKYVAAYNVPDSPCPGGMCPTFKANHITKAHADPANIELAQKALSVKWGEIAEAANKKSKLLEVSNLQPWWGDEMSEGMAKQNPIFLFGGGLLMFCFCALTLVSWKHPQASRGGLGFTGLFMVLLAELTAFSLMFIFDFYLNSVITIAMPLLAMGLGVDDMFVLVRYFSNFGFDFIEQAPPEEITGELMAIAGPGTTLTSVCNMLAFGCGTFLPIQGMADFCRCAVFVALSNYLVMTTIFLCAFVRDINRIKRRGPDPHPLTYCYHRYIIKQDEEAAPEKKRGSIIATSSEAFSKSMEKRICVWLRDVYAPFLCKPVVSGIVTVIGLALLAVSIYLIENAKMGWGPQDLLEAGQSKRGVELTFKKFSLFGCQLVVHDVDIAERQMDIQALMSNILSQTYTGGGTFTFLFMMQYITLLGAQAGAAALNAGKCQHLPAPHNAAFCNRAPTMPETIAAAQIGGFYWNMKDCGAKGCPYPTIGPMGKFDAKLHFAAHNSAEFWPSPLNGVEKMGDKRTVSPLEYGNKAKAGIPVPYFDKVLGILRKIPADPLDAWKGTPLFMYADYADVNNFVFTEQSAQCKQYDGMYAMGSKWDSTTKQRMGGQMSDVVACMTPKIMAGAGACMTPKITAGAAACMGPLITTCVGAGKSQADCTDEAQTTCTKDGSPLYNSAMASCTQEGSALHNAAMGSCADVVQTATMEGTAAAGCGGDWLPTPATSDNTGCYLPNRSRTSGVRECKVMKPKYIRLSYLNIDLTTEDKFIDAIKEGDAAVDASALKGNAFIYSGITTFWKVFISLKPQFNNLIILDSCIIFVITLLFFSFDVVTALITCISCLMIVLEIYGLSAALMNFNIFVAAFSLMAMGLAVEFTVHLAAAFSLAGDEAPEKILGEAMSHTFPALIDGSISTFLGVLPLAFHPIAFIVKYMFVIITLVVVIGLLNGLLFMPAMLALLAPVMQKLKCSKKGAGYEGSTNVTKVSPESDAAPMNN